MKLVYCWFTATSSNLSLNVDKDVLWLKEGIWMKCNALTKMHVLAAPKKWTNVHARFQFA